MTKIIQVINVPDTDNFQGCLMGLDDQGGIWGFQNGVWDFVSASPKHVSPKALILAGGKMNQLIFDLQTECTRYLAGDSAKPDEFINKIIGMLDGPEQRSIQALWQSCKASR